MSKKYRAVIIGHTGQGNYGHGLDVVYEAVGGALFDTALRALAVKGRLISIGMSTPAESISRCLVPEILMWCSGS